MFFLLILCIFLRVPPPCNLPAPLITTLLQIFFGFVNNGQVRVGARDLFPLRAFSYMPGQGKWRYLYPFLN